MKKKWKRGLRKVERVRLYPTPTQTRALQKMLDVTRDLYNAALQHRIQEYKRAGFSVSEKVQKHELTEVREAYPWVASVYRECEDAVLQRLGLGYDAAFRRIREWHERKASNGDQKAPKPGFPRFRSAARWSTLEFPHGDRALKLNEPQTKLRIPGVGSVRLRKGRAIGTYTRAFVTRKCGKWYALFDCVAEFEPLPATNKTIGIDCGVAVLAATSDGGFEQLPYTLHARHNQVIAAQIKLSRSKRGSKRRRKARAALARAHERVATARRDVLHKLSRKLVDRNDVIALEDLKIENMVRSAKGTVEEPGKNVAAKSGLNREIHNASWGMLRKLIVEKAAWAARRVILVDPKNTSRTCSLCGHVSALSRRSQAVFVCVRCDYAVDADTNAARNILRRAELSARSPVYTREREPAASCVTTGAEPALGTAA